jgi:hypothetical protein
MNKNDVIVSLNRRDLRWLLLILAVAVAWVAVPQLNAQKIQDEYSDTFKIATDDGGIAIAASADGKYVYLVGKKGLIVSDEYGKTGTFVQTLKLK